MDEVFVLIRVHLWLNSVASRVLRPLRDFVVNIRVHPHPYRAGKKLKCYRGPAILRS